MSTCEPRAKEAWRERLLLARAARSESDRRHDAERLRGAVSDLVRPGATVAAYMPMRAEPGDATLLDALRGNGVTVLLPMVREGRALSWGAYSGCSRMTSGPYGLREPDDRDGRPRGLRDADLVLVPALAIDRRGVRLGRGAGYYDRALSALRDREIPRVAVVHDDELLDELPSESHDVRMTHVITPLRGLLEIPVDTIPRFHVTVVSNP
ncbi:5-formyltetrahydrofolate cyclo-ligase [Gordonia rhizosphera]|uniref:5-formyltetrahydrofolate cyclo-ligase n=1 Tax=Gordonia rhizosphera NBRC 16068 TaxID=1108045 RepID=K6W1F9_9ACTN|nr:5-formyltetrahydrofolate cyclo-ligase [Gordonia rhizosphera]GAB93005.1 5-formyltetrahydrofolate cyclo-ligase family protein [Gordonia rhizosphera NBRC 16068]